MTELEVLNQQLLDYFSGVERVFSEQQKTLNLACLSGCGSCCLNPDVTATLLEMIPIAIHLFQQGQAEQIYKALSETSQKNCFFYAPESKDGEQGRCSIYFHRPLLCRIFGAFPRRDKWNNNELSVCKKIKQERTIAYEVAINNLRNFSFDELAWAHTWKLKVMNLRPDIGTEEFPINFATIQAITFTALYYRV
ncbi:MAG: YkgJ family cysteine cluster protein [Bdellovibrio sp.]|nr:YkgJ family cysteine cluster protein [Bdellovibrio sp.]